jgi:hypothetical protein
MAMIFYGILGIGALFILVPLGALAIACWRVSIVIISILIGSALGGGLGMIVSICFGIGLVAVLSIGVEVGKSILSPKKTSV